MSLWTTVPTPDAQVLDVVTGPDGRIWFSTFDQIWRVLEPPSGPAAVAGELAIQGAQPLRFNAYKVPLMRNLVKRAIRGVEPWTTS